MRALDASRKSTDTTVSPIPCWDAKVPLTQPHSDRAETLAKSPDDPRATTYRPSLASMSALGVRLVKS